MDSWAFVLFVVFLVLKLCGVIQWSWWWVLSPFWIPVVVVLAVFVILVLIAFVVATIEKVTR